MARRAAGPTCSCWRPPLPPGWATSAVGASLATEALGQFRARSRDGSMRALNLLGAIHWERGHVADAELCFGEAQ